jgi:exopolysaccharide biosynthesis protein
MKKSNHRLIINIGLIVILSFILIYAGQFLYSERTSHSSVPAVAADTGDGADAEYTTGNKPTKELPFPIDYRHVSATVGGLKQEMFILEFDPTDPRIEFKPVLSYDSIFGFEKLSDICKRTGAYAAVNGGFFYEYGDPVGMVAANGEIFMNSTGFSPVLIVDKEGARFKTFYSSLSLVSGNRKIKIDEMNRVGKEGRVILYTDKFGSTNRAEITNTSIQIENNTVTSIFKDVKEVNINKGSRLISFYGKNSSLPEELGIKTGDKADVKIEPYLGYGFAAYECGSMLVKDGKAVVPEQDRWAGVLGNRDPRTVVGIKKDGRMVLLVADGRQPGYSSGLTGDEMAEYLIDMGVRDAAMLDGGATSQIFVDGKLRNTPSYEGIERPVAGAFIVRVK